MAPVSSVLLVQYARIVVFIQIHSGYLNRLTSSRPAMQEARCPVSIPARPRPSSAAGEVKGLTRASEGDTIDQLQDQICNPRSGY